MRRKAPRLAAAFVVTLTACSAAPPPEEPHPNPPEPVMNPPGPPDTAAPFATPPGATSTAAPVATSEALPPAPQGWRVEHNPDGTCTAYGPDPCNHPGCNPPPPRKVACQ